MIKDILYFMINLLKNKRVQRFFIVFLVLAIILIAVILIFNLTNDKNPVCKNCNIILISLDTLSANHLPCYGYARDTAPNLCKIGNDNIIFKNAFSNANWTLPSHVSIFTSLYPEYHNVIFYGDGLSQKIPFLPEILQKNGYETYFYIPGGSLSLPIDNVYSRGITKILPYSFGLGDIAHEDFYSDPYNNYYNNAFNSFLLNVEQGKKTFMFVHTYAVHAPYLIDKNKEIIYTKDNFENIPLHLKENNTISVPFTQEIYERLLADMALEKKGVFWRQWRVFLDENFCEKLKNAKTLEEAEKIAKSQGNGLFWSFYSPVSPYFSKVDTNDPKQVEYVKALYDQKIKELDEWLGNELTFFLANPIIKKNTIVIITSDHGEEFMEHGAMEHKTVYDSNLKIPLILYIPGVTNKTITAPVQSVDLVPTILDAVGISADKFFFQGQSLINLIQKNIKTERLLVADGHGNTTRVIRKENWKLFLFKDENNNYLPYELYDTNLDPNESNNVLSSRMSLVNEMIEEYNSYKESWDYLLKPKLTSE